MEADQHARKAHGGGAAAPGSEPPIHPEDAYVVVLNWNGREDTLACLASLQAAWFASARTIVVDNGSVDDSVPAIRAQFPFVEVLPLPCNHGYAGGNNAGIRAALARGARAVLVLNNDTTVAGDFLGWLLHVLNQDPRAGAVSAAIMRQDCPDLLDVAYLEIYFGNGLVRRHGVNAMPGQGFDRLRRVDAGVGSCLLFRATTLEQVGLFDEDYFAYHEEVDWCFRAGQRGFSVYYQPLSRVWHHGSRSTPAEAPPALDAREPDRPQLDQPMPVPWNPVRTYLGARNTVRFVRTHATLRQRLYFSLSSLYALPLSLLAVLAGREGALLLGSWGYRDALLDLTAPRTPTARRGPLGRLARLPRAIFWSLPRAFAQARRNGRTQQVREHLRGLLDGALRRPLPLSRLGLR